MRDILDASAECETNGKLTRALRLLARADLALRSNPVTKRLVLEKLVIDLCAEPAQIASQWTQEQLVL